MKCHLRGRAESLGDKVISSPSIKLWDQTVAHVRTLDRVLVRIADEVSGLVRRGHLELHNAKPGTRRRRWRVIYNQGQPNPERVNEGAERSSLHL